MVDLYDNKTDIAEIGIAKKLELREFWARKLYEKRHGWLIKHTEYLANSIEPMVDKLYEYGGFTRHNPKLAMVQIIRNIKADKSCKCLSYSTTYQSYGRKNSELNDTNGPFFDRYPYAAHRQIGAWNHGYTKFTKYNRQIQ